MKAPKAKMQENDGPKGQNERKSRPKRPKKKEMKKGKTFQNEAGPGAVKFFIWDKGQNGPFLVVGEDPTDRAPKM